MSTAALSWDAMLNMTKIELEIFSYADMYLLFEKSVIGRLLSFLRDIVKATVSI